VTKLEDLELIKLIPQNAQDTYVISSANMLDKEYKKIINLMKTVLVNNNIEEIEDEKIIDSLAKESHVDFYDETLDIDVKKQLVKNSLYLHQIKGTKRAIELIINDVFGTGEVLEWHEYGGNKFYFKVRTENNLVKQEEIDRFKKAIETVKNVRSHLEKIEIDIRTEINERYFATIIKSQVVTFSEEAVQ